MAPQAFDSKQIALGITGGIAAYKACDVIRELYRQGAHQVIPMLSPSAKAFITPLTLESLSRHRVIESDLETTDDGTPTHIALAQQCDGLLILPATANTLAKLAHGLADNIITTTALTFTDKPVVVAPAMNTRMWFNPATQRNLSLLASYGHIDVIPPDAGLLACGETGPGKLASLDLILL
ncbi:MAG TPA: flavoprotein, partial [Acidobacteriota bacterium]|nr:flavoprotein [Acidobacteriota bacterium]